MACSSKLGVEVYAPSWLRLYRAVAERNDVQLAEMLEGAERAFLAAVRAGEVHRDAHWAPWYVDHMRGRQS